MKTIVSIGLFFLCVMSFAGTSPGNKAPDFSLLDANGKTVKLSDQLGKWVVVEWFNKDCPFVKKHYGSKNMQGLQEKYTAKKVVWLTIQSSAEGKQGFMKAEEIAEVQKQLGYKGTTILRDPDGKVGNAYGAKTTPHMFVINPKGEVVYAGAIDDNDSSDPSVIPASTNYVAAALDAGMAGKKIQVSATRPYGCSVKY